jgi:predicted ribonuclease toxin of YeeF-YezG toxin-antitoxin module|tara:strand:- start:1171 stop:1281 length:111 start_codon:yes stop_codon:yes gene_type:complete
MIKNNQKENIKDVISELSDLMEDMKIALEKIIRLLR